MEILQLGGEVKTDREKEDIRKRRRRWRKKIRKETNIEEMQKMIVEYKRMKNRERHLSKKKRKIKQRLEAEQIEILCREYDGIAWEWLKKLIPKRKKQKQEITEVIDNEGRIRGKEEVMKVWREAYETLGRETEKEDDEYDREHKEKIIKELREIEEKDKENKKNNGNGEEEKEMNRPISINEVREIIKELKNGKATGNDKITNEIIKKRRRKCEKNDMDNDRKMF